MNSNQDIFQTVFQPHPKILAIGKNYEKHIKEMGGDIPKEPCIFTKPLTSIYVPELNNHIYTLPSHGRQIHHEIELGVMICKQGKNIPQSEAMQYVGGYFLAFDMTDRDLQGQFKKEGFPWDLAKGQDAFMPISKFIPLDNVKDPHNLHLILRINDKIVQEDSTSTMVFKIPKIIEYISQFITLTPGDLILTGTPHGVGPFKDGDQVLGEVLQESEVLASIQLKVVKSQ